MTRLENLPDEIWLKIFNYLSFVDLFGTFIDLNKRINSMITTKKISIELKEHHENIESLFLMKEYPEKIESLSIEYSYSQFPLESLRNLKSLRLIYPTQNQIELIRSNYFEDLKNLILVVCPENHQLETILFGEKASKSLNSCWFPNLNVRDGDFQCSSQLRSLRLNFCDFQTYFRLLNLLPNLNRFQTRFISSNSSEEIREEHFNLTRMKISFGQLVLLKDLELILSPLSSLENLVFHFYQPKITRHQFKFEQLIKIFKKHFHTLKKCSIQLNFSSDRLKIDLEELKEIRMKINNFI